MQFNSANNQKTASFYNSISPIYSLIDWKLKDKKKKLVQVLNSLPEGNVLDIGAGTATYWEELKNYRITAIDLSINMLNKNNLNHVKCIQMDGESLNFNNNSFDYIILSHVLSVTNDPNQLLKEAHRVLKKDGTLFILNHFSQGLIQSLFDKCFHELCKWFRFQLYFPKTKLKKLSMFRKTHSQTLSKVPFYQLLILKK